MAANPYTTNLEAQWDARDITGLSDGDSVTTWTDSSAAGNDMTQATGSKKPVYKTNIIGSNPVVRFQGNRTANLSCSIASSWSGFNGVTIFTVAQWNSQASWNFPLLISVSTSTGFFTSGFWIYAGETTFSPYGRMAHGTYGGGVYDDSPLACLTKGVPSVFGCTAKYNTAGVKSILPMGTSAERATTQIDAVPTHFVMGNPYNGGSISENYGFVGDVALMLIYKEYMSDSNSADVLDWILTEFDLHTQAAGGSAGILRTPGMTGGING